MIYSTPVSVQPVRDNCQLPSWFSFESMLGYIQVHITGMSINTYQKMETILDIPFFLHIAPRSLYLAPVNVEPNKVR
jgi:hypothetical protein